MLEAQKVSSGSANVQYIDKEGLIPSAYDQTATLSRGPLIALGRSLDGVERHPGTGLPSL